MAFLGAVARFIAVDKLKSLGEEVLAKGRVRFAREMASGKSKEEAARIAAKYMLKLAGKQSADSLKGAARKAGSVASRASRALRRRMKG